jgi:formylglycine-generating enzyme required for sulfatase activity
VVSTPFIRRSRTHPRRRSSALGIQQLEPRLALANAAGAITPIMVPIGNPKNAADPTTGYGRVAESYQIGKYEVTIGEYVAFLNAVATSEADGDPDNLYDSKMEGDKTSAGITRSGSSGAYTYAATGPAGVAPAGANDPANRPVTYVTWFDAARFANWMANGQPTGGKDGSTTENGGYDMSGTNASGTPPARNAINPNTGAAPRFFLPTENQWYKAAYYGPALRSNAGGYYRFATQSNDTPGNAIGSGANLANYILSTGQMTVTQQPIIEATQNYLTNVGAMSGSGSSYGTFDQSGGVWELIDTGGKDGTSTILRGGGWTSFTAYMASTYRLSVDAKAAASNAGFRLAAPAATAAAVTIDLVTVRDAGNAADQTTGKGAVGYDYRIGRTDVTIGQYTAFLNAVAKSDPRGLYNPQMAKDLNVAGINRVGRPGSYSYSVMNNAGSSADRPIAYVSWFDAARFANWMANGQPAGGQTARTTENGSYNLARATGGRTVPRNATNPNTRGTPTFFIPTENEWFKAAYYKGGGTSAGYWMYATQGDAPPTNDAANASAGLPWANYLQGVIYCTTQSATYAPTQNYLTAADALPEFAAHYGTLNQSGTLYQWNDLDGTAGLMRGVRGGFWAGGSITLKRTTSAQVVATQEANDTGFRLVGAPLQTARRTAASHAFASIGAAPSR